MNIYILYRFPDSFLRRCLGMNSFTVISIMCYVVVGQKYQHNKTTISSSFPRAFRLFTIHNINRLMSEELLSNDRRVVKHPTVIRTIDLPLNHHMHLQLGYLSLIVAMLQPSLYQQQALLRSESNRGHSKMKNESVKKSLVKECSRRKAQKRSSNEFA